MEVERTQVVFHFSILGGKETDQKAAVTLSSSSMSHSWQELGPMCHPCLTVNATMESLAS